MIETFNGVSLVTLANEAVLCSTSTFMGCELGPPLWVRCIADSSKEAPAARITLVRWPGESCDALWARVLAAIRELKQPRGVCHQVRVIFTRAEPPRNPARGDTRFNLIHALEHEADYHPDSMRRVAALYMLHSVVNQA